MGCPKHNRRVGRYLPTNGEQNAKLFIFNGKYSGKKLIKANYILYKAYFKILYLRQIILGTIRIDRDSSYRIFTIVYIISNQFII